jgi:hypothetical protein
MRGRPCFYAFGLTAWGWIHLLIGVGLPAKTATPCRPSPQSTRRRLAEWRFGRKGSSHHFGSAPCPGSPRPDGRIVKPRRSKRWRRGDLAARNPYSMGLYPITTGSGRLIDRPSSGSYWRASAEKLAELNTGGRIYWGPKGESPPAIKRYLSEVSAGRVPGSVWPPEESRRCRPIPLRGARSQLPD